MAANFGPERVQVTGYRDPTKGLRESLTGIQQQLNLEEQRKAAEERNRILDQRYETEQAYKESERKRIADERAKALGIEEAVKRVDLGYGVSADPRIKGVEEEVLARPELIGDVSGTPEERAQHEKFIKEITAKYDEAGLMDKDAAYDEAYRAYRTAGASRAEAQAGAEGKVRGMKTKAEKLAAAQSVADKQFEDKKWAYEQQAKAIADQNKNIAKVQSAAAKRYNSKEGSTSTVGSIANKLAKGVTDTADIPKVYDMLAEFKSKGYTDRQIDAVLPAAIEKDNWIFDEAVDREALTNALAASFPPGPDGKPSREPATGGYGDGYEFGKPGVLPTRKAVTAVPQRSSEELRKECIARMDGTYKAPGTAASRPAEDRRPVGTGVTHPGSKKATVGTRAPIAQGIETSAGIPAREVPVRPTFVPSENLGGVAGAQTLRDVMSGYGVPAVAPIDRTTKNIEATQALSNKLQSISGNAEPSLQEQMFLASVKDPTAYIESIDKVMQTKAPIEAKRAELRSLGFPASLIQKILR